MITSMILAAAIGQQATTEFVEEKPSSEEMAAARDAVRGKAAPKLPVTNWMNAGEKGLTWKDLKGKVVLIDFWGTWCGPCRASIPHLKELYAKNKDNGFVIIGVHTTNGAEKMEAYVKEQNMSYPIAADVEGKTVKLFGINSFPDYAIIDRKGVVRATDLANSQVDKVVAQLLKEKA